MFSKPILVAGIIATVQSTAIIAPKGILPLVARVGNAVASTTSCMDCLRFNDDTTGWVYKLVTSAGVSFQKSVWWMTITTMVKKLPITDVQIGEGTCAGHASTGNGSGGTLANVGAALYTDANTLTTATYGRIQAPTTGVWNVLAMVSQCPAYNLVCGAKPTVTATGATIGASFRTVVLNKKGAAATLPMAVPINTASNNYLKEVCSFVVKSNCGAPIVTIGADSTATLGDFKLWVTEYTDKTGGTLWGTGSELWWLPTTGSDAHVYPVSTPAKKLGNAELGNVSMYQASTAAYAAQTNEYDRVVPGSTLADWMAGITAQYAKYTATVALFDAARKEWDAGKRGAKPFSPSQPADIPASLNQLVPYPGTGTKVAALAKTAGFGNVSQYEISWTAVNLKAGKYFGTLAGLSTLTGAAAGSISTTAKAGSHWHTNAGKTFDGATAALKCDGAYVMVTAQLQTINSAAVRTFNVVVTEGEWASTLEEQIPKRPVAVTAPAATGAAYLTVGAAATLAALSLF